MELKVWVDGIQRVICGVSDTTTCQDIVLALAHATGRTGRFTLIEKWRSNERPLAPDEQPLQVLHKWGEYAADVQFMLIQTDKDGLKSPSRTRLPSHDKKDRFTHNFTPPHHGDSSIKRSFTFSGAPSGNSFTSPARKREKFREVFHESSISEESELGSSSHASHQSPSSVKPTAVSRSPNHKLPGAPSSNHRLESHALDRTSRQKSPLRSAPVNSDSTSSCQVRRSNGRPIPKPRSRGSSSSTTNGPKSLDTYLSQNSPPDFQEAWSSSPLPEFEEYDLDRNFPNTSPQTRGAKNQATHASKADGNSSSDESQEYSSLVKLVSQQQDRLQVQESEISKIETEIKELEEKGRAEEERLRQLESEILSWEGRTGACECELEDLVSEGWQDQLEAQVQTEHSLKAEADALRTQITNCQQQIVEMVHKRESIIEDIEREKKDIAEREKKETEVELRVKQEVADVQKKVSEKQAEIEQGEVKLEVLTKEVKDLDAAILEKKLQVAELESSLKEANLQQFVITPPETPNHLEEGESALFKQLHRPPATRKASPQDFSSTVTTSEHPDGVWV